MKKIKKRVAVLYGGKGFEHDISVLGGKFVTAMLDPDKFKIIPIFIDRAGAWYECAGKKPVPVTPHQKKGVGGILRRGRFIPLDAAFPILHGDFGEDGRLQGLLETLGIPFVGCDTIAGAVCADKGFAKAVVKELGIPTLPWCQSSGEPSEVFAELCEARLGYPVFIKPSRLGSSFGTALANSKEELLCAIRTAGELGGGRIIAERYLKNPRELECAFLELGGKKYFSHPGEIRTKGGFYSYSEKYSDTSSARVLPRADIDAELSEKIRTYTEKIVSALSVRGLARVDFFFSDGEIYFNEINTMPGMTEASLYPRLAEEMGVSPTELVNGLVTDTLGDGL